MLRLCSRRWSCATFACDDRYLHWRKKISNRKLSSCPLFVCVFKNRVSRFVCSLVVISLGFVSSFPESVGKACEAERVSD
jgi:hypothetical protein